MTEVENGPPLGTLPAHGTGACLPTGVDASVACPPLRLSFRWGSMRFCLKISRFWEPGLFIARNCLEVLVPGFLWSPVPQLLVLLMEINCLNQGAPGMPSGAHTRVTSLTIKAEPHQGNPNPKTIEGSRAHRKLISKLLHFCKNCNSVTVKRKIFLSESSPPTTSRLRGQQKRRNVSKKHRRYITNKC